MDKGTASWKLVGGVAAMAAAATTRLVLRTVWSRFKGDAPPENPAAPGTSWPDALIWAASSGVALGVSRVIAQRGAAEAWKATTGDYPAALEHAA